MSPALIVLLYRQTERDLAASARLQLDAFASVVAEALGGKEARGSIERLHRVLDDIVNRVDPREAVSPEAVKRNFKSFITRMRGHGMVAPN